MVLFLLEFDDKRRLKPPNLFVTPNLFVEYSEHALMGTRDGSQ